MLRLEAEMITAINSYELNTRINDYPEGMLIEFSAHSYQWASDFGVQRIFKNEKYYWTRETIFLGKECTEAIVAAVDGVIYKISFRFHDSEDKSCLEFREKVFNHLAGQMGTNFEVQEIDSIKLLIWSGDEGNVILELDGYDTDIILTSSIIRNMKRAKI